MTPRPLSALLPHWLGEARRSVSGRALAGILASGEAQELEVRLQPVCHIQAQLALEGHGLRYQPWLKYFALTFARIEHAFIALSPLHRGIQRRPHRHGSQITLEFNGVDGLLPWPSVTQWELHCETLPIGEIMADHADTKRRRLLF